ncbi:MAG: hypothetical protein AB8I08_26565 [Sandaracinaceae bacterium]
MSSLLEVFQNAGLFGYAIVLCCTAAFPLGLLAIGAAFKHKGAGLGLGGLTLFAGLTQWGIGLVAYLRAQSMIDSAVAHANPEDVALMRAYGESEAQPVLMMGCCMGAIGLLAGVAAIAVALAKKRPEK